jgi:hypothetical protein
MDSGLVGHWASSRLRNSLAAIATMATLVTGTQSAASWREQEDVLDHFLCYTIEGSVKQDVKLNDQFPIESKPIKVVKRLYLCNPVEKTYRDRTVERKHLASHLVCYEIPQDKFERAVTVANQILPEGGPLSVDHARYLCLPSGKSKGEPSKKEPKKKEYKKPKIPTDLSHFKCYGPKITGKEGPPQLGMHLHDQFVNEDFKLATDQPDLCNPVDKTLLKDGEEKKTFKQLHPDAHLVCYLLAPKPHAEDVRIKNQFEDTIVRTSYATRLCVPSTKS